MRRAERAASFVKSGVGCASSGCRAPVAGGSGTLVTTLRVPTRWLREADLRCVVGGVPYRAAVFCCYAPQREVVP